MLARIKSDDYSHRERLSLDRRRQRTRGAVLQLVAESSGLYEFERL